MVSRDQLRAAGLSRSAIAHRVATGRLHPMFPGTYVVGRPSPESWGSEIAAILYLDGRAVLSHRSAGALWGLIPTPDEVTVTALTDRRSRPGLRVHRTTSLQPADIRTRQGIPVTSPARTVSDIAGELTPGGLEQVVAEAHAQRLLRDGDLEAALRRGGKRKGSGAVRALLAAEGGPKFTRRDAERWMLALVRAAGLPVPRVNASLLGFEIDFLWEHERLAVETDGWQFHGHRSRFEADRRRDQILIAAGYRVMRITWRQLRDEPLAVIARLAMALGRAAA